jgi:hypothetical protein
MTSATYTYTQTINLTPYWPEKKPNIILIATYYTTSGYSYRASITGPGGIALNFPDNNSGVQTNALTAPYVPGETLQYLVTITSDSPTLSMQVQNSTEIGTKADGTAITYQGFMFSNDAGGDKDWNDCVITLALFNDSTD